MLPNNLLITSSCLKSNFWLCFWPLLILIFFLCLSLLKHCPSLAKKPIQTCVEVNRKTINIDADSLIICKKMKEQFADFHLLCINQHFCFALFNFFIYPFKDTNTFYSIQMLCKQIQHLYFPFSVLIFQDKS